VIETQISGTLQTHFHR